MFRSESGIDELAAHIAAVEQTHAAALADLQADMASLRELVGRLSSDVEPAIGFDPAMIVTTDHAAVIRVQHTFDNETTPQAPYALGPNTIGQLVSGLNADKLDGQDGAYYNDYTNLSNKPTAITLYTASAGLTLTTALQDVAGLTTGSFTPSVSEKELVMVNIACNKYGGTAPTLNGDTVVSQLQVNGTSVLAMNIVADSGLGSLGITRAWVMTLNAGTTYTIKVQSQNVAGNRGLVGAASQMLVWRMPA
ncbi:MAG TPA: hypothetical protein VGK87_04210 [Anaerolineae bacterium]